MEVAWPRRGSQHALLFDNGASLLCRPSRVPKLGRPGPSCVSPCEAAEIATTTKKKAGAWPNASKQAVMYRTSLAKSRIQIRFGLDPIRQVQVLSFGMLRPVTSELPSGLRPRLRAAARNLPGPGDS